MDASELHLSHSHQVVLNRFVAACQADERVVAAFLRGSSVKGAADAYSDLDLSLITTDEAYEAFFAEREAFIQRLGEPLFVEDFGSTDTVFLIFSDGTEVELSLGRESHFKHIHGGSYHVLLDKKDILTGAVFPWHGAEPAEQIETLRQLIYWFWHDLSHFITALGRGQLWWAYGQLEVLRLMCVNLARLRHNFSDPYIGEEGYFKVEQALTAEQLSPLQATYCPMEPEAIHQAVLAILSFYQELAPPLARTHGLTYPAGLEQVMVAQLEKLGQARLP